MWFLKKYDKILNQDDQSEILTVFFNPNGAKTPRAVRMGAKSHHTHTTTLRFQEGRIHGLIESIPDELVRSTVN